MDDEGGGPASVQLADPKLDLSQFLVAGVG
jgi:hypothetical protein